MTKAVQRRRGTNAEHASFTGLEGELSVNTTNDSVHVHDGATAGGFELARADGSNVGNFSVGGDLDVTGNVTIGGNITLGDADTDGITVNADLTSSLIPNADDTYDLGSASKQWRNLYVDGTAEIDSLSIDGTAITATAAELNYTDGVTSAIQTQLDAKAPIDAATFTGTTTIPTADINSGTIDGVTIGGSSAGAGTFTTFTSTGIDDNASSTAITIDSSQNVGIGTSTIVAKVTLSQDQDIAFSAGNSAVGGIVFRDTGGADSGRIRFNGVGSNQACDITFETGTSGGSPALTERMRIDSSGNVGIGTSSPSTRMHIKQSADNFYSGYRVERNSSTAQWGTLSNHGGATWLGSVDTGGGGNQILVFGRSTDGTTFTESMRIDTSGNVLVAQTTTSSYINDPGIALREIGLLTVTRDDGLPLLINRLTNGGDAIEFRKDNSTKGRITVDTAYIAICGTGAGLSPRSSDVIPTNASGVGSDNAIDLGDPSYRFDDIYATNGTIQTSDEREKQDIEELSQAEQNVAVAAKSLLRKYRWKDSVAEKGDAARIHFGIIAQDLKAAFEAEGLDAGRYAMFTNSEWWETYTDVPAVEAQDAVYEDVTIPAVTEEQLVTEAVLDDEGNEVEPAVYETVVVEEERIEQQLVSEAVEAKEAYTRIDQYDTEAEAPEGAVKKDRMGIRYNELLAFIIAAI